MLNREWKNMDMRFGGAVCVPASCSTEMISQLMVEIFKGKNLTLSTDYEQEDFCQTRESKPLKVVDQAAV